MIAWRAWLSRHALVDAHFAGETSARQDRRLFEHLRTCERCRARYRVHARLESLEPGSARARLGRSLFPPARGRIALGAVLATATAAAVLALVLRPRDDAFQPRGAVPAMSDPSVAIQMFRVSAKAPPERVGSTIRAGDALAFAYVNPPGSGWDHLLVFARDTTGRLYWFWPAWREAHENPVAIAIERGREPIELGEAVRHDFPPGPLAVYAVFSRQPLSVKAVEDVALRDPKGLAGLEGVVLTESLEVLP